MPSRRADTFTNYLYRQRHRADRVGDFAREWLSDIGDFPKPRGRYSWRSVRAFLERNNACEPAILAARKAWSEWIGAQPDDAIFELPKLLVKHGIIPPDALKNGTPKAVQALVQEFESMLTPPFN